MDRYSVDWECRVVWINQGAVELVDINVEFDGEVVKQMRPSLSFG